MRLRLNTVHVRLLISSAINSYQIFNSPLFFSPRYLHACSAVPLTPGRYGVLVAGGYSQEYLDTAELFDPTIGEYHGPGGQGGWNYTECNKFGRF